MYYCSSLLNTWYGVTAWASRTCPLICWRLPCLNRLPCRFKCGWDIPWNLWPASICQPSRFCVILSLEARPLHVQLLQLSFFPLLLLVTARDKHWRSVDLLPQERFVEDALESKTGEAAAGWAWWNVMEWQHSYARMQAALWNATVRCCYMLQFMHIQVTHME